MSDLEDLRRILIGTRSREAFQVEMKSELQTELKPQLQSQIKSELEVQLPVELKPELKSELHSELKPELKAELHSELKPQLKREIEVDLQHAIGGIKGEVDHIRERLEDEEERTDQIAAVLPVAISRSDDDLNDALEKPVNIAIRNSVQRNPNDFADLLFPVMGPAIRAAIADAMRSMMSSINESVEATLSVRGLKWRLQAWRSGMPYAEIALQNTLVYRVEQVFLISRKSSLLIDHSTAPNVIEQDSDAVSAMFSAIQDFVRDSFSRNENDALREIEVGGHTVWSVHGPYAMLVAVVRGTPPSALRHRLLATLESIHRKYGGSLRRFEGESSSIPGLESRLRDCLELEFKSDGRAKDKELVDDKPQDVASDNRTGWLGRLGFTSLTPQLLLTRAFPVALACVAVVAWFLHSSKMEDRHDAALAIVEDTPGFKVIKSEHDGRQISLEGLQDPLATLDYDRLDEAGVERESLTLAMESYLSLEPAIVERRAAQMLALPESITVSIDESRVLHLSGVITDEMAQRIDDLNNGVLLPGVRQVNTSGLRLSRGEEKSGRSVKNDNENTTEQAAAIK